MGMIIHDSSQGECPKCLKDGCLNYGAFEIDDSGGFYPYECSECGVKGKEFYDLMFAYSEAKDENDTYQGNG